MFLDHVSDFSHSDIVFKALTECGLIFAVSRSKIASNFKSQGTEQFELFSQGTYDSQNLTYETLVIPDCEYAKISRIAVFDMKLWLKEQNILHKFEPYSF